MKTFRVPNASEFSQSVALAMMANNGSLPGDEIPIEVIRDISFWTLIVGMFGVGLGTDPMKMIKYAKIPIVPIIGVLCQFIIMPCITIASIKIVNFTSKLPSGLTIVFGVARQFCMGW